jgi:hypothetical protein
MRRLQVAMRRGSAAMLCLMMGAPAALAGPPIIETKRPQACTTITSRDLRNAGSGDSIVDTVLSLPLPGERSGQPQPACPTPENRSPQPPNPFALRILDIQNSERLAVGAPPLRWNPALEASATAWAEQLARIGQEIHAPREGRGIERENLQKGLIGWGPDRFLRDWLSEKRDFVAGTYPNVALDGDWANVSHYTQIIWPTTTEVGCAMASSATTDYFVCRYAPTGNKDGFYLAEQPRLAEGGN